MVSRSSISAIFSALRISLLAILVTCFAACGGGGGGFGYEGGGDRGTGAERTYLIQGTLRNAEGVIASAPISIRDSQGELRAEAVTGSAGEFSLSVISPDAGALTLEVETSFGLQQSTLTPASQVLNIDVLVAESGLEVTTAQSDNQTSVDTSESAAATQDESSPVASKKPFKGIALKFKLSANSAAQTITTVAWEYGAQVGTSDVSAGSEQKVLIPAKFVSAGQTLRVSIAGKDLIVSDGSDLSGSKFLFVFGWAQNGAFGIHVKRSKDGTTTSVSNNVYPPNSSGTSGGDSNASGDSASSGSVSGDGAGAGAAGDSGQEDSSSGTGADAGTQGATGSGGDSDSGVNLGSTSNPPVSGGGTSTDSGSASSDAGGAAGSLAGGSSGSSSSSSGTQGGASQGTGNKRPGPGGGISR